MLNRLKQHYEKYGLGHGNKLSREYLCNHFEVSDRTIRQHNEALRLIGVPILPDLDKGGYFLARKDNAIDRIHMDRFRKKSKVKGNPGIQIKTLF